MNRLILALLLGLFLLASISAQAGGRGGHHGQNHRHCNKHHRHYVHHQRHYAHHQRHAYTRGHRCKRCWNDGRYRHDAHAYPYVLPRFEFGVAYGAPGFETVVVYRERGGH